MCKKHSRTAISQTSSASQRRMISGRNGSASIAVTAVITTGKWAGKQPAITALMATFSAVIARWSTGSMPTRWSGGSPAHSRPAVTASPVGGTIGSPSVQPREW